MKIVDISPIPSDPKTMTIVDRLMTTLRLGFSWQAEVEAVHRITGVLRRLLDNKYTLARNVLLPGSSAPIPLVLFGPTGIRVLNITNLSGVFRAKGESWSSVDVQQRYRPAKPNLLTTTTEMANKLGEFLQSSGHAYPGPEPVLLCANPGMHVETIRPNVRVVMSDALDRFAASLGQSTSVMSVAEIETAMAMLVNAMQPKAPAPAAEPAAVQKPRKPVKAPRFNTMQTVILAGLALAVLVVVSLLIVAIAFSR